YAGESAAIGSEEKLVLVHAQNLVGVIQFVAREGQDATARVIGATHVLSSAQTNLGLEVRSARVLEHPGYRAINRAIRCDRQSHRRSIDRSIGRIPGAAPATGWGWSLGAKRSDDQREA